ncbi:GNAT family N-acetyltransferase [Bacillus sp. FJAT-27445]|uniref:GNAT family N-acetyltransferase n=1 Tax=Bacillus sp. FJAT-27445 TaxID=1679166 RepID=UPI000743DE2B|nr:GNAT family protein [Bacillus sp. FJAT-27445]
MDMIIDKMNEHYASEIVSWKYKPPYDFYNSSSTPDGIMEFMDNPYYAVLDLSGALAGFFCVGESAQVPTDSQDVVYERTCIDIGLGMKPSLTGQGLGYTFFAFILDYIQKTLPGNPLRLTVASFNQRATWLYKKSGFTETHRFKRGSVEFIVMEKA